MRMLPEQNGLLKLLDEIHEISEKIGIRYYIVEESLQCAFSNITECIIFGYGADIAMTFSDYDKFEKHVRKNGPAGRRFESVNTNDKFPDFYINYVNEETMMYDLDYINEIEVEGIRVKIHLLQKSGHLLNKIQQMRKKYCDSFYFDLDQYKKNSMGDIIGNVEGKTNTRGPVGRLMMKKAYKLFLENCWTENSPEKACILSNNGEYTELPTDFFKKDIFVYLNQHKYRTINYAYCYLTRRFGRGFEDIPIIVPKENLMAFANPNVSYRKVTKDAEFSDVDLKYLKDKKKLRYELDYVYDPYTQLVKKGIKLFFAGEERMHCWKKYINQKDSIMNLWNSGKHDEAILMLNDYTDLLAKYEQFDVTICFDYDLWTIYIEWLKENGNINYANRLTSLLLPKDIVPIVYNSNAKWS